MSRFLRSFAETAGRIAAGLRFGFVIYPVLRWQLASRHVNSHILLLAVTAALMLLLARLAATAQSCKPSPFLLLGLGSLAGFGNALKCCRLSV